MDDRNLLTIAAALGEAAFQTALRGVAMFFATLVLLGLLMGTAVVSSVIEASQPQAAGDDVLLMPAKEPGNTM